ncbi:MULTISPECIES: type I-F CRISPR-associated protein Csy1 [Chromohalobacter]|nr:MULTISPECIES: type I-F CRISPR-associated protein Csy1 [Chromohalobacter]MCI0509770.1 type I-F CRISPR-associated protein Csy1 [Chromohalobacter sp.]MCI0592402.1 type I-F CRISPR-associated protein Csy1 [Chromohalobacter sp.]
MTQQAAGIREVIERFIKERFDAKAEKLATDDPKYQTLVEQFQRDAWLNDAAKRIQSSMRGENPIKFATHTVKATHPDARGTNLWFRERSDDGLNFVSTDSLGSGYFVDVVGNAAYKLNEYKFLLLSAPNGERLLDLAMQGDQEFCQAIGGSQEDGANLAKIFAKLAQPGAVSHTLAKQVYWLTGEDAVDNDDFHLLAPLYATSLAHHVFQTINHDRFSDAAKEARKAKREGKLSEQEVHAYPDIAAQKMGGTKPQNISQLNSERGGNNYLLASLPPTWNSRDINPPLKMDSVFSHRGMFGRRKGVRALVGDLKRFLETNPNTDMHTRDLHDDYTAMIMDELVLFTMQMHSLDSGWSADESCRLAVEEAFWLDPGRAQEDAEFRKARHGSGWPDEVRQRFANWLNAELGGKLPLGDVEFRHWKKELGQDASHQRLLDKDRRWMAVLMEELDDLDELQGGEDDE